jgi:hypothetical protein
LWDSKSPIDGKDVSKMPGIRIDWSTLEAAFENHDPSVRAYLERATGLIVTLSADSPAAERQRIVASPDLFITVEPVASREQYRMMERFIETVVHEPLKQKLADSIVGKGAFRRFKDVVARYPTERKRWFAFRDVLLHQFILEWLSAERVELIEIPDWSLELPPPTDEPVDEVSDDVVEAQPGEATDVDDLKAYLHAWARAHGEEYRYLFGPASFERLAEDVTQEFLIQRRR